MEGQTQGVLRVRDKLQELWALCRAASCPASLTAVSSVASGLDPAPALG